MPKLLVPSEKPPLSRTYWVVEGKFLAGAYAGQPEPIAQDKRLKSLFDAGMRTFVNLMEIGETNNDGEAFVPYEEHLQQIAMQSNKCIECLRFPIPDRHITTHEHMHVILDAIDASLSNSRPVYVHCFGGIGRTGTVVCCWLLCHGYATRENVFDILKQLRMADSDRSWPEAPENELQRKFVLESINEPIKTPARMVLTAKHSPLATNNDWLSKLTGFSERSPDEVREHISVQENRLTSHVNGQSYECGRLEIVSLRDLRERVADLGQNAAKLQLAELVGDARALHADKASAGAFFQVASQFNLLEMVSPDVTPERGIAIYEHDATQGPACAISCGAGTIYRNYFVDLDGQVGPTATRQVDCLAQIGEALGNMLSTCQFLSPEVAVAKEGRGEQTARSSLWEMKNGYALPSLAGLQQVDLMLAKMSEMELDALRAKLQIGIQWDTQVTLDGCCHLVSQAYCAALPVAYSELPLQLWERFARLILEAAYEATFAGAVLNSSRTGIRSVYLTLLGGGAFGNSSSWILDAIHRACRRYQHSDLQVKIVSYRCSSPDVQRLCDRI